MTFSLKDLFQRKSKQKSHSIELRPAINPVDCVIEPYAVSTTSYAPPWFFNKTSVYSRTISYPGEFTEDALADLGRVEKQYGPWSSEAVSVREYWLGKCKVPTYSKDAPPFPEIPYPENLKEKI